MIYENTNIQIAKNNYEILTHKTNDLNYAVYHVDLKAYHNGLCPLHWHREVELGVILKGQIKLIADQKEIILAENEGYFVNTNVLHALVKETDDAEVLSVVFDDAYVTDMQKNKIYENYILPLIKDNKVHYIGIYNSIDWQKQVIQTILEIYRLSKSEEYGHELFIRNYLANILLVINQHRFENNDQSVNMIDNRIYPMIEYIKNNYQKDIHISDIASYANISIRECYRRFNNYLATSPAKLIENIRLANAIDLLLNTKLSIKEICFACGYQNLSYFCRKFKDQFKITPSLYRERQHR